MREKKAERKYTEQSPFVRLLETPGRVKILDIFLRKPQTELSAEDISKLADISRSTFSRNKKVLIKLDLISKVRSESGTEYYSLNQNNEINKILEKAQTELFRHKKYVSKRTEIKEKDHIGKIAITEAKGQAKRDDIKGEDSESPIDPLSIE